jgi:hypothetical protein
MNSKDKNFKRILALERRQDEIREAQRKLGYEKLDEPYQKGWDGYWVLRDDIARSEGGERLSGLIEHFGRTIFSPTKDFKTWSKGDRKYHDHKPYFGKVDEETYDRYYSWVQEWFVYDPSEDRQWWNGVKRYYRFTIPEWMLVMKKEKHWVTEYKVMDEVLEQEYTELSDKIAELLDYRSWWRRGDKSAKHYQKFRNRSFRAKEKREVKKAMRSGNFDDMDLPIEKKQVPWDMW